MKKIIVTTVIILTTGALATSGIKLVKQSQLKDQTILIQSNSSSGREIASAD